MKRAAFLLSKLAALPPDMLWFAVGLASFAVGLFMIYPPAAFIGAGLVIMLLIVFWNVIP